MLHLKLDSLINHQLSADCRYSNKNHVRYKGYRFIHLYLNQIFQYFPRKNIESTLCISTLIWTILDNIKKTLSFATLSFKTLVNVETTFQCENDVKMTISRKGEKIISNWIQWFLNFNHFFIIFFTLIIPLLRGTY